MFFSKLPSYGPGDLQALAKAIGSKCETEVRTYLDLLEQGAIEASATLPPKSSFSVADVPAAFYVSEECRQALEAAADDLMYRLEEQGTKSWKEKFGDHWLVDDALANEIEVQTKQNDVVQVDDDVPSTSEDDAGAADDDVGANIPPLLLSISSAQLLRPTSFLQLSRSLFMNGPADTDTNWTNLVPDQNASSGPAMYRSAFEDLHRLAVAMTQRLVQAAVFQANSRLRANDCKTGNEQPDAVVSKSDVRIAVDGLGWKPDWKAYWATAARRHEVDVYTETKMHKDGRPRVRDRVYLTYDEVEAELGSDSPRLLYEDGAEEENDYEDEGFDDLSLDSDLLTLERHEAVPPRKPAYEAEPIETERVENGTISEDDADHRKTNGKRALSATPFEQAEDEYLESLDHQVSTEEERRLWQVLQKEIPESLQKQDSQVLPKPTAKLREMKEGQNWRCKAGYREPWEQAICLPDEVAFQTMDKRGRMKKERKRVRLDGSTSPRESTMTGVATSRDTVLGSESGSNQEPEDNEAEM